MIQKTIAIFILLVILALIVNTIGVEEVGHATSELVVLVSDVVDNVRTELARGSTGTPANSPTPNNAPSSAGKMQQEVERGQAPRDVTRVDGPHDYPGAQPHIHFRDGTALNKDGTAHHGVPNPSNRVKEWIRSHGWEVN